MEGIHRLWGQFITGVVQVFRLQGSVLQANFGQVTQALTFAAAVPWDAALGQLATVTATTNAAHTIGAPSNVTVGQRLTLTISNTSGGAMATTGFNAAFNLAGAWTAPATGKNRSVEFRVNTVSAAGAATNLSELWRTAADVAN